MATLTVIDGKLFDQHGNEVDRFGRPFTGKRPEVLARIKQMQAEAKERAKHVHYDTPEKEAAAKDVSRLRGRLDGLRESIFHARCHLEFLKDISSLHIYEEKVNDVDEQIRQLQAYRTHLTDMRDRREQLKGETISRIQKFDNEILDILDELEEADKVLSPSKTRKVYDKVKPDIARQKAEIFLASMNPAIVQQYLQTHTREELLDKLVKTMGGMSK
jgi:chromosome segregation ATPase